MEFLEQLSKEVIVIRHFFGGGLRTAPQKCNQIDGYGMTDDCAQWKILLFKDDMIQLRNLESGKYLRCVDLSLDANGEPTDMNTLFVCHVESSDKEENAAVVQLESANAPGFYVYVCNDQAYTTCLRQHNLCYLFLMRLHQMRHPTQRHHLLSSPNVSTQFPVLIQHKFKSYLRIKPNKQSVLCSKGQTGPFARWFIYVIESPQAEATVMKCKAKLKNEMSGHYLRMNEDGSGFDVNGDIDDGLCLFDIIFVNSSNKNDTSEIKVCSSTFNERFLAVKPDDEICVDPKGDDDFCTFTLFQIPEHFFFLRQKQILASRYSNIERKLQLELHGTKIFVNCASALCTTTILNEKDSSDEKKEEEQDEEEKKEEVENYFDSYSFNAEEKQQDESEEWATIKHLCL
ncbi:hypothetical protein RFI_35092 [Reticulomyxa filosa]|uniref:Uncharacterized protein n=1 Tax=Reticulomyxa filosa TaxID=46433 RepID=X6LL52_RETFI|nr:hypothetical protein RFI_35092 [Reticulomyxa filosa]|eukprot:ETO02344.1 hypothetical protein RFI_35092 [Reticulomyxa filosa]